MQFEERMVDLMIHCILFNSILTRNIYQDILVMHLPCDRNTHEPVNSIKAKHHSRLAILFTEYNCACN